MAPENTLAAFRAGIEAGADYIEADLVSTQDGQLVASHDAELSRTTDIERHPEFRNRRRTLTGGWYVDDFTLAELRELRVQGERIPTLPEIIALVRNTPVGLYLEVKQPAYFNRKGLHVERLLDAALEVAKLDRRGAHVIIESFDPNSLRELRGLVVVPLVQLMTEASKWDDDVRPEGLRAIARYAKGIGVGKERIVHDGGLVRRAHAAGLYVHVWVLDDDEADNEYFLAKGVDGIFSDAPEVAVRVRSSTAPERAAACPKASPLR